MTKIILAAVICLLATGAFSQNMASKRPRASDLGLKVGILPTGSLDAITDVAGVEVGHTTIVRGTDIRTRGRTRSTASPNPNHHVRKLLEITKLDTVLRVCSSGEAQAAGA